MSVTSGRGSFQGSAASSVNSSPAPSDGGGGASSRGRLFNSSAASSVNSRPASSNGDGGDGGESVRTYFRQGDQDAADQETKEFLPPDATQESGKPGGVAMSSSEKVEQWLPLSTEKINALLCDKKYIPTQEVVEALQASNSDRTAAEKARLTNIVISRLIDKQKFTQARQGLETLGENLTADEKARLTNIVISRLIAKQQFIQARRGLETLGENLTADEKAVFLDLLQSAKGYSYQEQQYE